MDDRQRRTGLRLRRAFRLGTAALTLAGGLALAAGTGAAAAQHSPGTHRSPGKAALNPSWSQAEGITLPSGASATAGSQLLGVGCTPSGAYCVAGGYYAASSTSGTFPMIVTYSAGTWGKAVRLQLPSNAQSKPMAQVTSVSCPTASTCVALGYYRYVNSGTKRNVFVAQQSSGGWGRGHTIPMPSNLASPTNAWSSQITCPGAGNCTATGQYVDKDGDRESFAINESGGKWMQGHWIWTPPDAPKTGKKVQPYGVACSSDSSCVIVGKYLTAKGDTESYVVAGQTTSQWTATAQRVNAPSGALSGTGQVAGLHGVRCFSAGNCLAVGNYLTSSAGTTGADFVSESGGHWASQAAQFPATPSNAASTPYSQVSGFACFGPADCVTVGSYINSGGHVSPLSDAYSGTPMWQPATGVAPPAVPYQSASLKDVSCWGTAPWTCAAAGSYVNTSGHTLPMVAMSS